MNEKEFDLEATWVTALLDVGVLRVELERSAVAEGYRWYGDGKVDDLQDSTKYATALQSVYAQYCRQPTSWTRLLSYLANSTMFSENEEALRENLIKIAAMTVAWVEDIDRRSRNGAKDGK